MYCTSFNESLYAATGHKLIESFAECQKEKIFVGFDGQFANDNVISYNLNKDPILEKWFLENKDIIPESRGGKLKKQKNYWKERAYDWFKKIITVNAACRNNPDYIIWLDCDCVIKKNIPNELIKTLCDKQDAVYLQGRERDFPEMGFVIYNLENQGKNLIDKIINFYLSKEFKKYDRWDDCLSFSVNKKGFKTLDIATKVSNFNGSGTDVFPDSSIGEYIDHYKGQHSRVLGIV